MKDHELRVVEEKADLDDKLKKLQKFVFSETFSSLDLGERWRLTTQCHIMTEYSAILTARISEFKS